MCPGGTCLYTTGTSVSPNASTSECKALVREGFSGSGFSEGRRGSRAAPVLLWFLESPSVPWAGILARSALMAPQCDTPLGPSPSSSVRWFSGDRMTQGTKQTTFRAGSGPTLSRGW